MKRKLIIAPYLGQRVLFKKYRNDDIFSDTKFITKEELIANYYYSYSDDAIKFIIKEKNCDLDYARRLLNIVIYLNEYNKDFDELFKLKDKLIANNLLIKNELFIHELNQSEIYIHYYNDDPIIDKILKDFEHHYIKEDDKELNDFIAFNNNDDQLFYIFNKIEELLKAGVPANKIFLYGLLDDDEVIFERLKKNYHINFNNAYKKRLINIKEVRDFVHNYSGNFDAAVSFINNDFPQYDEVIDLINQFHIGGIDPLLQKSIYKQIFSSKMIKEDLFVEAVNVINEPIINEDEYLFIINYAQGVFPRAYRDDDILDDNDKKKLGVSLSSEKNTAENNYLINTLKQKGNIYFSYAKKNYSSKFMPSPLKNRLNQKEIKFETYSDIYSFDEARIQYAQRLDLNRKYLHDDSIFEAYKKKDDFKHFDYLSYNPQVKGIKRFNFTQELKLSYSSVKIYYECQYKYYLSKIAKVDDLEDSFSMALGNIGHKIMEYFDRSNDFDTLYDLAYKEVSRTYSFTPRDNVLLIRLKEELRKTFDYLLEYEKQVENGVFDREKEFKNIYLTSNILLTGKVDKVIYSGKDSEYISIIDYKIGSESFNENNVQYGLSLQLPTYALFAQLDKSLKDKQVIALAIQPLLSKNVDSAFKDDCDLYQAGLKMFGTYIDDQRILYTIDKNIFEKSKYLGGVSISTKGMITASSKIYNQQWFKDIADKAKELIVNAGESILDNEFKINPKLTGGKNISCQYCPFRNICYYDYRHLVVLDNEEGEED